MDLLEVSHSRHRISTHTRPKHASALFLDKSSCSANYHFAICYTSHKNCIYEAPFLSQSYAPTFRSRTVNTAWYQYQTSSRKPSSLVCELLLYLLAKTKDPCKVTRVRQDVAAGQRTRRSTKMSIEPEHHSIKVRGPASYATQSPAPSAPPPSPRSLPPPSRPRPPPASPRPAN